MVAQRTMMVDGKRVRLTPEQYGQLVQMSGQPAKQYLAEFIQTPEWRAMTDDQRREEVKGVLEEFRAVARVELKARHPELGGEAANDDTPPLPSGFVRTP